MNESIVLEYWAAELSILFSDRKIGDSISKIEKITKGNRISLDLIQGNNKYLLERTGREVLNSRLQDLHQAVAEYKNTRSFASPILPDETLYGAFWEGVKAALYHIGIRDDCEWFPIEEDDFNEFFRYLADVERPEDIE